jgi:hypothetical protein
MIWISFITTIIRTIGHFFIWNDIVLLIFYTIHYVLLKNPQEFDP